MASPNRTLTAAAVRLPVSVRALTVIAALLGIVVWCETLVFAGRLEYALWSYTLFLLGLPLLAIAGQWSDLTATLQAVALIPAFRLVNLTMPLFTEFTLLWLPLVYGPFILAIGYVVWRESRGEGATADAAEGLPHGGLHHGLPRWVGGTRSGRLRRPLGRIWRALTPDSDASTARTALCRALQGLYLILVPVALVAGLAASFALVVHLAEIESSIIGSRPLIPSLTDPQVATLGVVMVAFVGLGEELIFRGILQRTLERQLGIVPGLVLASGVYGAMHSAYGLPSEIAFAAGVGLIFGIIYDLTDSLALVAAMHGVLDVLVFGIIPLDGGSAVDLVRRTVVTVLQRNDAGWVAEWVLEWTALLAV